MPNSLKLGRALVVALMIGVIAAAVASSSFAGGTSASATPAKQATKAQWAKIVSAAKSEGAVTLYSSGNPIYLADLAKKFEEVYGIKVTVNRQIDAVLVQQVTAEEGTGRVNADIYVTATKSHLIGAQLPQNNWATDAVGPALFSKDFDRATFAKPLKAVVVGINVNCLGWNTSQWSTRLTDFPQILQQSLKGRIGVIAPSSFSIQDFYHWLEDNYGKNFLPQLAALSPKIYTSALPMTQAIASGEISVGIFAATSALDLKTAGAPIDCTVVKGPNTWNITWQGIILKKAPHPNAAQLLMNYMMTKEGQSIMNKRLGSPVKGSPNTFSVAAPRAQNLKLSTPAKVAEYQAYWDGLFRK